jgi:hypothetical protein
MSSVKKLILTSKAIASKPAKVRKISDWVIYVKKFAADNGLKYNEALKNPKLKEGYIPAPKPAKAPKAPKAPKAEEDKLKKTPYDGPLKEWVKEQKPMKKPIESMMENMMVEMKSEPQKVKKERKKKDMILIVEEPIMQELMTVVEEPKKKTKEKTKGSKIMKKEVVLM